MHYVIFKENPNTHQEQYLESVTEGDRRPIVGDNPLTALRFTTAAAAYAWAWDFHPLLDWWRVGIR